MRIEINDEREPFGQVECPKCKKGMNIVKVCEAVTEDHYKWCDARESESWLGAAAIAGWIGDPIDHLYPKEISSNLIGTYLLCEDCELKIHLWPEIGKTIYKGNLLTEADRLRVIIEFGEAWPPVEVVPRVADVAGSEELYKAIE